MHLRFDVVGALQIIVILMIMMRMIDDDEWRKIETWLLWNTNRKSYMPYHTAPLSMTLYKIQLSLQ